jgi:vancomycin permeability regulator SanA
VNKSDTPSPQAAVRTRERFAQVLAVDLSKATELQGATLHRADMGSYFKTLKSVIRAQRVGAAKRSGVFLD